MKQSETLLEEVSTTRGSDYLRVFVGNRKKIEPDSTPRYILTEPWIGYRFDPGS